MSYEEVKDEYDVNPDFKEYVDKYCNYYTSQIPLDVALKHKLVGFVAEVYKGQRTMYKKEN